MGGKDNQSLSAAEVMAVYAETGKKKAERPLGKMLILAVIAGTIIAFGGVATGVAAHSVESVSMAKLVSALLFGFCLGLIMLMGAELFTGNCMIPVSILEKKTSISKMLRNWLFVYCGNFVGCAIVALACARSGVFDLSGGGLALYTIKAAAAKCSLSFGSGVVLGIFCNMLVCTGVLCSLAAKDLTGRALGAYMPVVFFVLGGFEHCIANMYYIPAGLFALDIPGYAALAAEAGIDTSSLTWGSFLLNNLLPVTIGNIIGGMALGISMWAGHLRKGSVKVKAG